MSVKLNLHQKTRPYKIDIFGLQDNFIGTLQAYNDNFLGQVVEPRMEIKTDGSQSFSCKIPKFYLSEKPNTKVINPRWQDAENGVLAENTRVLKVTIQFSEDDIKTYPFIIDTITNRRDKNFATYKEIRANGLAFAELGKVGYKIELNSHTLEEDFKKDDTTVATIDYWLDKIFPNEKDEDGVVLKWLTPWSYEIRMDWRGFFQEFSETFIDGGLAGQQEGYKFYTSKNASYLDNRTKNWLTINAGDSGILYSGRDETKIYEDPHVADWDVRTTNGKESFYPLKVESFIEKARYIDCQNSNKYNITQTLAETFEVFCTYEYLCDANGYFVKTYEDEMGNLWTGKKVVFFNRAVKSDNPFTINYQHNLQSISRIIDTTELYSKMYVTPIASEIMDTGNVTIADTTLNPLLDDFILNFDYLYSVGSIDDYQKQKIKDYEINIHKINSSLIDLENQRNRLVVQINDLESKIAVGEKQLQSVQQELENYERLRDNEVTNESVLVNINNSRIMTMLQKEEGYFQGSLRLEGINAATMSGYGKKDYDTGAALFDQSNIYQVLTVPQYFSPENVWYYTCDEAGYPATLITSLTNPVLQQPGKLPNNTTTIGGFQVYLSLEYNPRNKYEAICRRFRSELNAMDAEIEANKLLLGDDETEGNIDSNQLKPKLKGLIDIIDATLAAKETANFKLERLLGPALREGYWQADSYDDPGEGYNALLKMRPQEQTETNVVGKASIGFDEEPFDNETLQYYYNDPLAIQEEDRLYYSYIDLSDIFNGIGEGVDAAENARVLSDFCIQISQPTYIWEMPAHSSLINGHAYYFLLDGKYYRFTNNSGTTYETNNNPQLYSIILNTQPNANQSFNIGIYANQTEGAPTLLCMFTTSAPIDTYQDATVGDAFNITNGLLGPGSYLSKRELYQNAGFTLAFMKKKGSEDDYIPVALLDLKDYDYSRYEHLQYRYYTEMEWQQMPTLHITTQTHENHDTIVYPRIFLRDKNVNTNTENLQILVNKNATVERLSNFEDYSILMRDGQPFITLKITNTNSISDILTNQYNIIYQVSRANEMLYLDAKRVARDNSKPKYSYEINVANIPDEMETLELGQLVNINDHNVDAFNEHGYISELAYQLDKPSGDKVIIANYKTKFEDLFQSLSAQSEAMKQNQTQLNIAAASFTTKGQVAPEVLQATLDNNNFAFSFGSSNIHMDESGGIILTNTQPYQNGVYGQVALRAGGIFCSDNLNPDGSRIWNNGITPQGVNASQIITGNINTNNITIGAQGDPFFRWTKNGLVAYKFNESENEDDPIIQERNSIIFNQNGLDYIVGGRSSLKLGWDGLKIEGVQGRLRLTSDTGLQLVNDDNQPLVTFGRRGNEYGMFFQDNNGNITLQAKNDGTLSLIDLLSIGDGKQSNNYAALCGSDKFAYRSNEYIRFWAGDATAANAPLIITEKGTIQAKEVIIPEGGKITFKGGAGQADKTITWNTIS